MRQACLLALIFTIAASETRAERTWFDGLIDMRKAAANQQASTRGVPLPDFGKDDYTFVAWFRTTEGGSLFAKTADRGDWPRGGKSLFIQEGSVCFDIGFVGVVRGRRTVTDGQWHHVAFCGGQPQKIYVDGRLDTVRDLDNTDDIRGHVFKLGDTADDFPEESQIKFVGALDDVCVFNRVLSREEIQSLISGVDSDDRDDLVAHWSFEGNCRDQSGSLNDVLSSGDIRFVPGKFGQAVRLSKAARLVVPCGESAEVRLWENLARDYRDAVSVQEMAWEREDDIWGPRWETDSYADIARRYARQAYRPSAAAEQLDELPTEAETIDQLRRVRQLYLESRRCERVMERLGELRLAALRQAIEASFVAGPDRTNLLTRLDRLETQATAWTREAPGPDAWQRWKSNAADLRSDAIVRLNPLFDFDRLVFVKRYTYNSSHFYTDFIDGVGHFGGNLCTLDLKTGEVVELLPQMRDGIFGRFDLSFDARRIVFDWKAAPREGFRIYEVAVDGTGLRQLTFPPADEEARIQKYDNSRNGGTARMYFHQTDDMHPCYLPDGGICFTSSRCEYGTLCDAPDHLSTAVLYRIDGDGGNLQKLTNSAVSEFSPSVMSDGYVLYTRWEYVDKGQLGIKCLWAMRPDGSGSKEIYGNDIQFPPTMLHGRQIPGEDSLFVMLGTPHYPQSGIGTVIRIDTEKNIRTREPMTYITPHVDIRQEPGWNHLVDGKWTRHTNGPLYMDPYPLSKSLFLVSHNPDKEWNDLRAYGLYVIDEFGNHELVYQDQEYSCWQPVPLRPRRKPPSLPTVRDDELAEQNLAVCVVSDVHHGMKGVERGEVKWLRIMEQLPRPWAARRFWEDDVEHTGLISRGSALAAKVTHGVVPVYDDGSAHFVVPADRNIYLQALDVDFMELQRERTYVNYRPGEVRSCVGCHEMPRDVPVVPAAGDLLALKKPPATPQPQPGDEAAARVLHYTTDVQPVLDRHCVRCHGSRAPAAELELTGELTRRFSRSYESILERDLVKTFDEGSDWGGTAYAPPRTVGSHASRLIAQVREGCPGNDRELPLADFVKLATWVDANAVYYGSYWGRRELKYRDHPNFRPVPTFEQAVSTQAPLDDRER